MCKDELSYYSKLPDEIKKLKETITQLTESNNNLNTYLNQCYNDCPYVEYNGITNEMKSTIQELIVYAYSKFSDNGDKADYIANRMTQVFNKVQWSCIFVKTSNYYGYNIRVVNDLYYTHTYKNILWVVYAGTFE